MRRYAVLAYGFAKRDFVMLQRYPLNFFGSLLTYFLVFMAIFWGGRELAPDAFTQSLDAIIVGYVLLTTVMDTFFSLSGMINNEAQYGTLEKLYASPFRFPTVMFAAVISSFVISAAIGTLNLLLVLLVTQRTLTIDVLTVGPIFALTLLQAIGLTFFLGGVALLFKRIRSLYSTLQIAVFGIISFALAGNLWARLLPVGQGTWMLHQAMARSRGLEDFSALDLGLLVGTTVVYLSLGYLVFHLTQHRARQHGLLDDY